MVSTPADRRAAAGIITGVLPVGITPGESDLRRRQSAGWGYPALFSGAPPVITTRDVKVIYRGRGRRMTAKKTIVSA